LELKKYATGQIRNIALVSHGGTGKTSMAEAFLYTTGTINRLGSTNAGNTTTDFDSEEIKRQITINASLAPCEWKNTKLNLIDTPGYFDFIGDVISSLRVADGAVVAVCAVSGVEVGTEKMWSYAEENKLPRLVFVNKLDRENANYDRVVGQLQDFFGLGTVPVQMPLGSEDNFRGVVDLVRMKAYVYSGDDGLSYKEEEVPEDLKAQALEYRDKLIEAVAESDDELLMKYLEGEALTDDEITNGLKIGVLQRKIFPILCGSAAKNLGMQPVLDFMVACLPAPADLETVSVSKPGQGEPVALRIDSKGPLAAQVFKTLADPYVGKVSYFKVFSGTFKGDTQIYNSNRRVSERVGQVFLMRGKTQINLEEVTAGDIGAVAKLSETATGDTLCDKNNPVIFAPIDFPDPVISFAVEPKTKGDEEKVGGGLTRFTEEDPTFRVERNTETKQTLISGMGDMHLEIIVSRLAKKFGVDVSLSTPRVPYRETIRSGAKAEYKHKKQSGGRGQYGHVFVEVNPLSRGEGFEFEDKIFGGSVPRQYIPAVEKGVRETLDTGVVAGYPVEDLKLTLYDGSFHTVDSSEMAFKIAGSGAFKKAMEQASPVLLEPVMDVEVTVPETFMGDIMGDLNSRRGRIQGMDSAQSLQIIRAQVPMVEMFKYAIDLRSMTQGRGYFTMKFSHYDEVPANIAEKVIEAAKKEKEEE
jgi:elongation factor G